MMESNDLQRANYSLRVKQMHKKHLLRENIARAILVIIIAVVLIFAFTNCTDNARTRQFGGTSTVALKSNTKLINITWKDSNMWYLTRPMRKDEIAETYTFTESSSLGVFNGTVIVEETRE